MAVPSRGAPPGIPALALAGALFVSIAAAEPLPNAWQMTDNSSAAGSTLGYTNILSAAQHLAATNSGFSLTVVARMVTNFSGTTRTMNMSYNLGTRRFLVWWHLNANGALTAELEGGATYLLTSNGLGSARYHTHEIIYNTNNSTASYVFDGEVKTNNWPTSATPESAGQIPGRIRWGAGSEPGRGQINYNSINFSIAGLGTVASYDAGTEGNPAVAPNPATQGWTLTPATPSAGMAVTNVSPDTALLPVATTLAADQFTTSSARLNGRANPQGWPTVAWFEWGTDTNYGNATAIQNLGAGGADVGVTNILSDLMVGPSYHYRLVASNAFGLRAGANHLLNVSFLQTSIPGLPGVSWSSVAWGDYDSDGRLDLLLTGHNGSTGVSQLWRNTGSGFNHVTASVAPGLPGVYESSVAWGDYDNDGRLDFLLTGATNILMLANSAVSQLWRNTGSGFSNLTLSVVPGLRGVLRSSAAWGDFDNDGRLDFLLTGSTNGFISGAISELWRNTGSGFSNVTLNVVPGLPGVWLSSVAWGDYDNDGRLDFLLAGRDANSKPVSQLWRNTGSGFSNVTASVAPDLPGVYDSSVAWGDYDHDGRLDFLLMGQSSNSIVSQLWRNTGGEFSNVTASVAPGLPGVRSGVAAWADFDQDGRLDFLITGWNGVTGLSQLWRNTGNGFSHATTSITPNLPGLDYSAAAWGDFDNDGRLDFLLTGTNIVSSSGATSQLWRNNLPGSNAPPAAPSGLSSTVARNSVTLRWTAPADDLTPAAGLNYNVRISTNSGGANIVSPHALADGTRLVPLMGNASPNLSAFIQNLPAGDYSWSVQAVDTSFAGSPFAAEGQFTVGLWLINPTRLPDGRFRFQVRAYSPGQVLATTNLTLPVDQWSPLPFPFIQLEPTLFQFTEVMPPPFPQPQQRFHRLRAQ